MLIKLLKYDLKCVRKMLFLLYGLTIICAIGSKISSFYAHGLSAISLLNVAFRALTLFMIASTLMYNMMRLWVRFKNSVFGDESYLTHTLPIAKKDIYLSKILAAIITITASILVSLTAVYISYGTSFAYGISYQSFDVAVDSSTMTEEERQQRMQDSINENQRLAIQGYRESIFANFMNCLSILLFSIWVALTGYFATIIGNNESKNKKTEPIILGTSLFFLCICLNYLLLFAFTDSGKNSVTPIEISLIIVAFYSLISVLYYVLGIKQLENNINVI